MKARYNRQFFYNWLKRVTAYTVITILLLVISDFAASSIDVDAIREVGRVSAVVYFIIFAGLSTLNFVLFPLLGIDESQK